MTELSSQTINQTSVLVMVVKLVYLPNNIKVIELERIPFAKFDGDVCGLMQGILRFEHLYTCGMMCYEAHQIKFIHHPHHSFLQYCEIFIPEGNFFLHHLLHLLFDEHLFVFVTRC